VPVLVCALAVAVAGYTVAGVVGVVRARRRRRATEARLHALGDALAGRLVEHIESPGQPAPDPAGGSGCPAIPAQRKP
jgi:hypothetical protein